VVGVLPERPNQEFEIISPCQPCAQLKKRCDRSFPCFHCRGKRDCHFGAEEISARAKSVFKLLCEHRLPHNDVARYSINLQCHRQDIKRVLKNSDAKDIFGRIQNLGVKDVAQDSTHFLMPDEMVLLMNQHSIYKIEWMRDGFYVANISPGYEDNITSKEHILLISSRADVPCKIVDTMNCGDITLGYKMWVESLESQMTEIKKVAPVYWKDKNTVCTTSIIMMSKMITPTSIISITILNRGSVYTF